MAKRRKKYQHCLNCGHEFSFTEDNFCPKCGQENDDKVKSLWYFMANFFNELFALDTRFFRTLPHFLFRPGRLTKAYIEGKRKRYLPPIRLYLILSFLYFFLFSFVVQEQFFFNDDFSNNSSEEAQETMKKLNEDLKKQNKEIQETVRKQLKDAGVSDTLDLGLDSLDDIIDTEVPKENANNNPAPNRKRTRMRDYNLNIFGKINIKKIANLYDQGLSEDEILDKLGMSHNTFNRTMVSRAIRFGEETPREVLGNFLEELPLMMFFMIPIFAFILKLFYFRKFYVIHLIFTLHLHSFYFLVFALSILFLNLDVGYEEYNFFITSIVLLLYTYKSFRHVYQQRRRWTFLKLNLVFFVYTIMLTIGLVGAFMASFFLG